MPAPKYQEMGHLVKQLRLQAGMTQPELAEAAGMDASTITRIEAGDRRPRPDPCKRLAAALGADTNSMLMGFGWAPDYHVDPDRAMNNEIRLALWEIGRAVMVDEHLSSVAREDRARFLDNLRAWQSRLAPRARGEKTIE